MDYAEVLNGDPTAEELDDINYTRQSLGLCGSSCQCNWSVLVQILKINELLQIKHDLMSPKWAKELCDHIIFHSAL